MGERRDIQNCLEQLESVSGDVPAIGGAQASETQRNKEAVGRAFEAWAEGDPKFCDILDDNVERTIARFEPSAQLPNHCAMPRFATRDLSFYLPIRREVVQVRRVTLFSIPSPCRLLDGRVARNLAQIQVARSIRSPSERLTPARRLERWWSAYRRARVT